MRTRHEFRLHVLTTLEGRSNLVNHLEQFTEVEWEAFEEVSQGNTVFRTAKEHRIGKQRYETWHAFWKGLKIGLFANG